jgi:OFA family oxalate/formate antiporter-like MFS transporter
MNNPETSSTPLVDAQQRRSWKISRGWSIVWVSFFTTAFVSGGSQYGFGLFVKPLEDAFGWSRTEINVSLSIGLISGLLAPVVGIVIDKYGTRKLVVGSLLTVAAAFILRVTMTELWHWYLSSALLAIGMPGTFQPVGKLIGTWFPRSRGRMMGTAITGNNVFGLVGAPTLTLVIATQGWRFAYGIITTGLVLVAIAAWLVIRDRPQGADLQSKHLRSSPQAPPEKRDYTLKEAFSGRTFWFLLLGVTCAGFSYPSFMTQLIPHLEAAGWTSSKAALGLTVLAGTALASKITWGWLSEKLTAQVSFVIAISIMAVGVGLVILSGSSNLTFGAILFFGSGFGGIGPLMSLVILDAFGLKNYGTIQGVVTLVLATVPVLIGPILAGQIYDTTHSYVASFWIAAGIFAMGGLLVGVAGRPERGL